MKVQVFNQKPKQNIYGGSIMKKEVVEREKEGINPPKKPDYLKIKPVESEADKLKDENLPTA